MIETPLTIPALSWACRRIENFYLVHQGSEWAEKIEALMILRDSLGIDDELMNQFVMWSEEFLDVDEAKEYAAAMMIGLMIGLIAADYQSET